MECYDKPGETGLDASFRRIREYVLQSENGFLLTHAVYDVKDSSCSRSRCNNVPREDSRESNKNRIDDRYATIERLYMEINAAEAHLQSLQSG